MNRSKKITSIDVARFAGVSQTTVSRAFNNPSSVNPETLQRIMDAARELNYVPNILASTLAGHQTNLIGVIVRDFENPFYTAFISQISKKLSANGKKILLFNGADQKNILDVLQEANSFQVSGLIIASATLSEQLTEQNIPTRIPVVMINRQTTSKYYCSVASDDIGSSRFVADYFISKGFHSFAFLSGPSTTPSSTKRQQGYIDRLSEWGYFHPYIIKSDYTYESGYDAMNRLLMMNPPLPLAILCANDLIALGAIDAIRQNSTWHIPEDISLIGYDDIVEDEWKAYQLSSMQMPIEQMIDVAFEYLNNYNEDPWLLSGKHLFPCTLIERKTTPP